MSEEGYSTYEIRVCAVRAVQRGWTVTDSADAFGVTRRTLHRWLERFERNGVNGLQRHPVSGRPRKLEELNEQELREIVLQPASAFGYETDLWTVARLHRVIQERYEIDLSRDTVWRRLREAGLTYQKPEREYCEIDEEARKKWRRDEVPKIRKCVEKSRAILYFQDESNVSLTAFLGKTWAPRGRTPRARVTGKRGGVRHQQARAFALSPARQTHCFPGGDRISGADAAASSPSPSGGRDGSSQAAYLAADESLHRKPTPPACVLPSQLFAGLEPR